MQAQTPVPRNIVIPKACRNCRIRKIRCSRDVPCSSCVTSGLPCSVQLQSANPRQDGVILSSDSYERLNTRISSLEDTVRSLVDHQRLVGERIESPTQHVHTNGQLADDDAYSALPEGESSFGSQALRASQVVEPSSENSQSPMFAEVLANLRSIARSQGLSGARRGDYLTMSENGVSRSGLELPPSAFALQLLRLLRERKGTQSLLFTFYGLHDCAQIEDQCRRVYLPIEPLSPAEMTLFNGMISIILRQLRKEDASGLNAEDVAHFQDICEKNFHAGVENFEVMAIPTSENALILSLAIIHAQSEAKLPLQWSLTATAARHCLTLGYHQEERLSQLSRLEAARARRLFWHIYISDKNLSSRLGRSSTIQDWDINVNMCDVSSDLGRAPWDLAFHSFIELSRIQGQIYETLYSSASRQKVATDRILLASRLEEALDRWYTGWSVLDASKAYDQNTFHNTFTPANVIYYSVLTLLHRGTTLSSDPTDISPSCFEAAQQGLKAHLSYYPKASAAGSNVISGYALWLFYYTSFTPFVVTFLHCVTTSNADDLKLLLEVLATLQHFGPNLEYAEKQYKVCSTLCRIAETFLNGQPSGTCQDSGHAETFCLPLQSPLPIDLAWSEPQFAFSVDAGDWNIHAIGGASFALQHQM